MPLTEPAAAGLGQLGSPTNDAAGLNGVPGIEPPAADTDGIGLGPPAGTELGVSEPGANAPGGREPGKACDVCVRGNVPGCILPELIIL